ncbi:MAG: BNR-4 repeat-containing protein [Anaerolineae bacterium]|nr:BNR-4 repeat-containing protein [Anaerolineae bacterium]
MRRWMGLIVPLLLLTLLLEGRGVLHAAPPPARLAGATTPVDVSQAPSDEEDAIYPDLARASSGTLYALWCDNRNDLGFDLFLASSTDRGASWSTPAAVVLTENAVPVRSSLVLDGTQLRIAWAEWTAGLEYQLYQLDVGGSPRLIPNEYTFLANQPSMALGAGGELHLVSEGGLPSSNKLSIIYSRRLAGASNWMTTTVVYSHTARSSSFDPQLAVSADGSRLHLVWNKRRVHQWTILYTEGIVGSSQVTWTTPITISGDMTTTWSPDIAVDAAGNLHVVWPEILAQDEQYVDYARYDAALGQWEEATRIGGPFRVNANNPYGTLPTVAASEFVAGAVCVAWNAFPRSTSTAEDIQLLCSPDGGVTWTTWDNMSRSAADGTVSIRPAMAMAPGNTAHVIWQELVPGGSAGSTDYQIYHARRLPLGIYLPVIIKMVL